MTDTIEEARDLLAAATPGPWVADGMIIYRDVGIQPHVCEVLNRACDADLIAAAPRLLTALADECERLRRRVAELESVMPSDEIMKTIYAVMIVAHNAPYYSPGTHLLSWLGRLDAAGKGTP